MHAATVRWAYAAGEFAFAATLLGVPDDGAQLTRGEAGR
jgi:hypothetical protein